MAKLPPPPKPKPDDFDKSSEWFYTMSEWFEDQGKIASAQLYIQRAQYHQEREHMAEFEARRPKRRQLRPGSAANSVGMNRDPYVTPPYQFCLAYREIDHRGCDLPHGHMQPDHHYTRSLSAEELDEARADEASRLTDATTIAKIFYGRSRHRSPFKVGMPRWEELNDSSREELIAHGLEATRVIRNRQLKEKSR